MIIALPDMEVTPYGVTFDQNPINMYSKFRRC